MRRLRLRVSCSVGGEGVHPTHVYPNMAVAPTAVLIAKLDTGAGLSVGFAQVVGGDGGAAEAGRAQHSARRERGADAAARAARRGALAARR